MDRGMLALSNDPLAEVEHLSIVMVKLYNVHHQLPANEPKGPTKTLSKAPVWGDCTGFTIPKWALKEENTSVTPQLLPIFEGSYFGEFLQPLETVPSVQKKIEARESTNSALISIEPSYRRAKKLADAGV